ncbi:MAG: hypothetical protein AB7H96_13595 [Vicinamibacterales bacterium]
MAMPTSPRALTVCIALMLGTLHAGAQRRETHITIPYLANSTRPSDLDYAAAQCDIAPNDRSMICRFRQVFLTPTSLDPSSCAITSNGYEQLFRRESTTRWVSAMDPEGECGLVEATTLEDGGGTRWSMTVKTTSTRNRDRAECQAAERSETYDWRAVKRMLPCTSVQPGAIER